MGYEIKYTYHPRKEEGPGYNEEITEEKRSKVGKPFDDTPLEKCAAAIMAQLARRDIWVVDVEVFELVKKEITFKESKDGKGIVLKNRRFSLNETAQMVAEDVVEAPPTPPMQMVPVAQAPQAQTAMIPANLPPNVQPHELIRTQQQDPNDLYGNPNKPVTVRHTVDPRTIDKSKRLYYVYYEPYLHMAEARSMKLKFTEDTKYPVHAVIPSATGKLDAQKIAVTDDSGQMVILDEKFFTSAGQGLLGDAELGFSEPRGQRRREPKLAFEDQMFYEHPEEKRAAAVAAMQGNGQPYKRINPQTGMPANQNVQMDIPGDIPLDDGTLPEEMFEIPDLRPGKKF